MTELFDIPETKSPRLIWLDKHGIKCAAPAHPARGIAKDWMAYQHNGDFICASAYGTTEDSAITALARKIGVRLWNEE